MQNAFAIDFGFSKESDPLKIEQDVLKLFPKETYKDINHLFVWHGRHLCKAQKPNCQICPLKDMCISFKKKK